MTISELYEAAAAASSRRRGDPLGPSALWTILYYAMICYAIL